MIKTLSRDIAEHVFANVGEYDDLCEPGTLQLFVEELMDCLR